MENIEHVVIIGGGFCGMMTAVHLIQLNQPVHVTIINDGYPFGKGVAYSAHTNKYLLNVRAINMSAFEDERYHFMEWLHHQPAYHHLPKNILTNVYAPRKIYGDYLQEIWHAAVKNKHSLTEINIIEQKAKNIEEFENGLHVFLDNDEIIKADSVVLATGNTAPAHKGIPDRNFLYSDKYFANPWNKECVNNVQDLKNILIIGNGLTMVDTAQGLLENKFKGKIYTISPNGYNLIPHRYNLMVYDKINEELPDATSLRELFAIVRNHIKSLTDVGIGAHLVIDALRPYTQKAWQNLSHEEKKYFLKRLSNAWTVLRHRLPMNIHELMQQLRMQQRMITIAGKIKFIDDSGASASITYVDRKNNENTILVDRVINCTGPQTNIFHSANELLRNLADNGTITPDPFYLGINADADTGAIINDKGEKSERIFATGGNLKGVLWESTSVPEIRIQVKKLALHLAIKKKQKVVVA